MIKKNSLRLIFLLLITLFVVGCGYSREELKLKKQYIHQGKINAVKYIKEKYGFEAKIDGAIALTYSSIYDLFPGYNGDVLVKMSYNKKEFEVEINGDDESIDGFDNYQEELIKENFIRVIFEEFDLIPTEYDISYGRFYRNKESDCLIKKYFDGNNLFEILNDSSAKIRLYYYEHNLKNYTNSSLFNNILSKTDIIVVNFRTVDDLNMLHDESFVSYSLYKYAFNISDVISFKNNTKEYYSFDLKPYDDFYYVTIGGTNVVINKCETDNLYNFTTNSKYKKISNSYCIDGNYDVIYLYYPLDKIRNHKYSDDSYSLVYQYYNKGEIKYTSPRYMSYIKDEYIYQSIVENEFKFVAIGKEK